MCCTLSIVSIHLYARILLMCVRVVILLPYRDTVVWFMYVQYVYEMCTIAFVCINNGKMNIES